MLVALQFCCRRVKHIFKIALQFRYYRVLSKALLGFSVPDNQPSMTAHHNHARNHDHNHNRTHTYSIAKAATMIVTTTTTMTLTVERRSLTRLQDHGQTSYIRAKCGFWKWCCRPTSLSIADRMAYQGGLKNEGHHSQPWLGVEGILVEVGRTLAMGRTPPWHALC